MEGVVERGDGDALETEAVLAVAAQVETGSKI
jgi:hypothetical protein